MRVRCINAGIDVARRGAPAEADNKQGAPVIVAWETGSNIARYEEAEGQMQAIHCKQKGSTIGF